LATVNVEDVSKRFLGRTTVDALQTVNLEFKEGEFVTVLGPSGSGKTTLLNIIVGIVPPTTGRVLLGGKDVTHADPRDRDMAMVFQNYALYPSKTVLGNLEFPLRMRRIGRSERRQKAEVMAHMLGLDSFLHQYPRQLSGGQQQRVALGRALIRDPQLFLMDEPLSNLDAKLRLQMRSEIKRLHREYPVTTIYVTHDQSEAMALSDRVVVMRDGRVVQVDTPAAIYSRPANSFVAAFVGMPAMNLIPVTVHQDGTHVVCKGTGGQTLARMAVEEKVTEGPGQLGIRPSRMPWSADRLAGDANWVPATVREVDTLGEDTLIHAEIAGEPVTILDRGPGNVGVGQEIHVALPPDELHLFAGEDGVAVQQKSPPVTSGLPT